MAETVVEGDKLKSSPSTDGVTPTDTDSATLNPADKLV
jgi:hypothetical protein